MTTATPETKQERDRPAPRELAIIAGFVVLVGIAIVTVLVPALRDDAHEEDEPAASGAAATGGAAAPAVTDPGALPAPPTDPVGP